MAVPPPTHTNTHAHTHTPTHAHTVTSSASKTRVGAHLEVDGGQNQGAYLRDQRQRNPVRDPRALWGLQPWGVGTREALKGLCTSKSLRRLRTSKALGRLGTRKALWNTPGIHFKACSSLWGGIHCIDTWGGTCWITLWDGICWINLQGCCGCQQICSYNSYFRQIWANPGFLGQSLQKVRRVYLNPLTEFWSLRCQNKE